jgi:hypothetical protein
MIKIKCHFLIVITFLSFFTFGCSKVDPTTGEVIRIEPDPDKKARAFADKGGGIFGDINNKKSGSTNFEFASSNVLWRATLKSLDFLPLLNADYAGGIIIFDWYAKDLNSNEQIKITVRFLNNEVRADSIKVISHKKTCDENGKCNTILLSENFSSEIKDGIIVAARSMKILDQKKDNK